MKNQIKKELKPELESQISTLRNQPSPVGSASAFLGAQEKGQEQQTVEPGHLPKGHFPNNF